MELPEVAQSQFNSQGGKGIHDPSRSTRYDERTGGPDKITVQGLNSDTEVGQITMNQRTSLDGMPKINTNANFLEVTRDDLQKETLPKGVIQIFVYFQSDEQRVGLLAVCV